MLTENIVRDMMLDPSKIKIPSISIHKLDFADLIVKIVSSAETAEDLEKLVPGFYKIILHPDVEPILVVSILDRIFLERLSCEERERILTQERLDMLCSIIVDNHISEFGKFHRRLDKARSTSKRLCNRLSKKAA